MIDKLYLEYQISKKSKMMEEKDKEKKNKERKYKEVILTEERKD